MLATYAGAASPGDGRNARVGGQVGGAFEPGDVARDGQEDLACGPDRDSGHTGRDREKRVVLQKGLDLGDELFALLAQLADAGGEYGGDFLDGLGAGHGHVLRADGVEQVVDDAVTASESCAFGPLAHACTAGAPHAGRPSVMLEQRQRGVAHDAVALEGAFERGVDLQQQATQPVDLPVAFPGQVFVESGERLEPGHGLVVAAGVAQGVGHMKRGERDHVRVPGIRLRVAGQQLGGLAHRRARQVEPMPRATARGSEPIVLGWSTTSSTLPCSPRRASSSRICASSCPSGLSTMRSPCRSSAHAWWDCLPMSNPSHTSMSSFLMARPPCLPTRQGRCVDWRDAGPDTRFRHPHYDETQRFTHVNFRAGRVPISGRWAFRPWRQHPPDHQRQGKKAIP